MALTSVQITNQIITQLKLIDPAISAEVGTPERKIIEAVAEQIASTASDLSVLDSQHDIDTMVGGRLDSFLSIFGFGRQKASAATGVVTFSRNSSATSDIVIPSGTQVIAKQSDIAFPDLYYVTTLTGVLATGQTSVDVPVICITPGTIGNAPASAVVAIASIQNIQGITKVTNTASMAGGIDGESDAEFKVRFKNTIFRNISGTTDQYLALAVAAPYVTKANVIGPMSRYQEYIQVPAVDDSVQIHTDYDAAGTIYPHKRTTVPSVIPFSKYTYSSNNFLTNGEFGTDTIFYRPNVDYVFNNPARHTDATIDVVALAANQPNVTITNLYNLSDNPDGTLRGGDTLLLEHAYLSTSSRNKISQVSSQNILNCVDVYVDGSNADYVSSIEVMPSSNNNFSAVPAAFTYSGNFSNDVDGGSPTLGNRFMPLFWQPVMSVPQSIVIGANRYYKANYYNIGDAKYYNDILHTIEAAYFFITDNSESYGSIRARNGIEWSSTVLGELVDPGSGGAAVVATDDTNVGLPMAVDNYSYDRNISDIQAVIERHKQVTTDVLVHQAIYRYFKLYITVMYAKGSTTSSVDQSIAQALSSFFKSQYFGTVVQLSDLLQVVHNVPGVDNVRWTNEYDTSKYSVSASLPVLPDILYPSGSVVRNTSTELLYKTDGATWTQLPHKVEEVNIDGTSHSGGAIFWDTDFYLLDDQLPAVSPYYAADVTKVISVVRRAQGTWNT
jgi:uncharacterized phage protein gp47/JayE